MSMFNACPTNEINIYIHVFSFLLDFLIKHKHDKDSAVLVNKHGVESAT